MSLVQGDSKVLCPEENDVQKLLACNAHIGTCNLVASMERYVTGRKKNGVHVLNLHMTWEKLMLAARCIVAVENPADVVAVSAREYGQRAVLKYAGHTGASSMAGRFCPGSFTNQMQTKFTQPRLIIITDPRTDHQAITEAAYVNIPIIAFCDTDSPLEHVDLAIPCNNRNRLSIGMMYWFLAREVLRMRSAIPRALPWEVAVDLFFYRDPDAKKEVEEDAKADDAKLAAITGGDDAGAWDETGDEWGN
ncbi:40S ribosomal protein SA [Diplonema papillatum]|nr:40S ribosomal protein SA [Diplonema papillatum]|eukprot:gene12251-18928_t